MAAVYRHFPSHEYTVRAMTAADAEEVLGWWSQQDAISRHELLIPLKVFPPDEPGFYIGEHKGEVVASAIRIPWSAQGKKVFFGSLYYVKEQYRGRGFGTLLRDNVAREHVGDNIIVVDAVEGKVASTNEKKFGYKTVGQTVRYQMTAQHNTSSKQGCRIVEAETVPFDKLAAFDDKYFIASGYSVRHDFLKEWIELPGGRSLVVLGEQEQVLGYGCRVPCVRPGEHLLEPLYASSPEVAEVILRSLADDVTGQEVFINIYASYQPAVDLVERLGMRECLRLVRQHVNGPFSERQEGVYGITSIDACGF